MQKIIPAVGLINLSKETKKNKRKYYNSNLYNTCYINSSIQCLFHLDEFINNILKCKGEKITQATIKLINDMVMFKNKNYRDLSVSEIKEAMGEINEKYKENIPEDANEFIINYLNAIIDETADKSKINRIEIYDQNDEEYINNDLFKKFYNRKGYSFIIDLFYGIRKTEKYCKNCNNYFSIKFNVDNIIQLPIRNLIDNNNSLKMSKILENFFSEEKILKNCSKCKKNDTYKKISLYSLPKCLILYLERNDDNENYIENDIEIPLTINFRNYMIKKDLENSNYFYNLKSVIYYSFTEDKKGHYTSSCHIGDKWYYFDDTYYESERKFYMNEDEYPVILFYEK